MKDFPTSLNQYNAEGWPIFPVAPGLKTPKVEGWQTYDGPILPTDNLGLITGEASGIIVLDVDANKGGWESLKKLEEKYGPIPETLRSVTANGGAHFFFARPNRPVRNGAGIYGMVGLDVRGDGGYVVVPPSSLDNDRRYQWDVGSPTALAPLPQWIAEHGEFRVRADALLPDAKYPEGTRKDTLVRIAGFLRHYGTPQGILAGMLEEINEAKCDPPLPKHEILDILNSADKWPQGHRPEVPVRPKAMALKASEFLSLVVKPPAMLIEGIWPEESIGFIVGPPKVFKSFVALELAYALASGADFLGRFKVPVARKVLLIQQESSLGSFQVRLGNCAKRMGDADNLYVISNRHISLENEVDLEKFEAEINAIHPALVILDPFASFIKGDENSAQAMGEVIRNLRRIRDDCKTGVCVVHHSTKQDRESLRGSQALYGAAEALLYVSRTDDREALKSRIKVELKESEGPEPFYVVLDSDTTALEIERTYARDDEYSQEHWGDILGSSGG